MTAQVRLTGDRSTEPELNDSIAFSRYTDAIDRISHEYLLWEKAQRDLQTYDKHYRIAQSTVESLGRSLPSVGTSEELQLVPSVSESEQILEHGIASAKRAKTLRINLEEKLNSAKSKFYQKKNELERKEQQFSFELLNLEKALNDLPLDNRSLLQQAENAIQQARNAVFLRKIRSLILDFFFWATPIISFWISFKLSEIIDYSASSNILFSRVFVTFFFGLIFTMLGLTH